MSQRKKGNVVTIIIVLVVLWIAVSVVGGILSDAGGKGPDGESVIDALASMAPAIFMFAIFAIFMRAIFSGAKKSTSQTNQRRNNRPSPRAPAQPARNASSSSRRSAPAQRPTPEAARRRQSTISSGHANRVQRAADRINRLVEDVHPNRLTGGAPGAPVSQIVFDAYVERSKPLRIVGLLLMAIGVAIGLHAVLCERFGGWGCGDGLYQSIYAVTSDIEDPLRYLAIFALTVAPGALMLVLARVAQRPLPSTVSGAQATGRRPPRPD